MKPGKLAGSVRWKDDDDSDRNGTRVIAIVDAESGEDVADIDVAETEDACRGPTEKEIMSKARIGQGVFRSRVLLREKFCRVTGVDDPRHLRASHISPWAGSSDDDRLSGFNGLMLAPHIDHLFDRGFISFENNGRLLVRNEETAALLAMWGCDLAKPKVAHRAFSEKQRKYLSKHRNNFFLLQKAG